MSFGRPSTSSGIKRKNEGGTFTTEPNQPADKRQKQGDENVDDWEEDEWVYSQANMQEMDLLSSQALAESARQTEEEPLFVAPKSSLPLKKVSSTSSSSSLSNGTESAYPSSNESYRRSSTSISSSSSSSENQSSYRFQSLSSFRGGQHERQSSIEISSELNRLKTDCKKLSEEKKMIERELYSKDGEIKNLRGKLQRRDVELNSLRTESLVKSAEQKQQQTDRERNLKMNNEKLETRLQFKEKEYSELEEKCRFLEHKLQLLSTSSPKKMVSSPRKSYSPSPKAVSPRPVKGQFPTGATFRADERPEVSLFKSIPATSAESTEDTSPVIGTTATRRCPLRSNFPSGEVDGPKLVAKLLDHSFNDESEISDRGVVGLLHTPSVSSNLTSLQFDRDQSNSLLSPVKNRKLSGSKEEPSEIKPIVDKEHYNLAVYGLQTLLRTVESCEDVNLNSYTSTSGAVLILPLLDDYFSHYVSMLTSNTQTSSETSPSHSGSLKSSSCESSIESLTSSLGLLLRDGAVYAQNMESFTSASLTTLKHLVSCSPAVRSVLYPKYDLIPDVDKNKKSITENPISEADSDMETDAMTASLFTAIPVSSSEPQQQLQTSDILNHVTQLATPSLENQVCSISITQQALDVLISLARNTEINQLDSLVSLTSVLNSCLQCYSHPKLVIEAIVLLSELSKSEKIMMSLTSPTVSCPLLTLYTLANIKFEDIDTDEKRQIHHKIIVCMFNISCNRSGLCQLLETSCSCSHEFTRSMVLIIHHVLEDYQQCKEEILLEVLKHGLQLLYTLYLYDNNLASTCRCFDAPHQYINLIWSLYAIFKLSPDHYENELNILSDIGPFIDEDDDDDDEEEESEEG